ncbi:MAG: formylglycine-generating enzyme family protein [Leptospirales bacterium]|nr:formylglycine-generating enzyme family protein [Leptospirales bacterium]
MQNAGRYAYGFCQHIIFLKNKNKKGKKMKKTRKRFVVILFVAAALLPQAVYLQTKTPEGFVHVKGGSFMMGSPANEVNLSLQQMYGEYDVDEVVRAWMLKTEKQRKVTVSPFYMSKYEITQAEWIAVMGSNPSMFKGDNLPVETVSWYDAVEYCNKRSVKEKLTPAYTINKKRIDPKKDENDKYNIKWTVTWNRKANGYRLPTEAEWEYACRAGTTTPFSTGNSITTDQANYDRDKTAPVGSFAPNPWGLYDMHGNVAEWCWDEIEVCQAICDAGRVIRGGSWDSGAQFLRSAYQGEGDFPNNWSNAPYGFRVVRN